jgi:hypothetical protein
LKSQADGSVVVSRRLARLEALLAASLTREKSQQDEDPSTHTEDDFVDAQEMDTTVRRTNDLSDEWPASIPEESQVIEVDSQMIDVPRPPNADDSTLSFPTTIPPHPASISEVQQNPRLSSSPKLVHLGRHAFSREATSASSAGLDPALTILSPQTISRGNNRNFEVTSTYPSITDSPGPSPEEEQEGNSVSASETVSVH